MLERLSWKRLVFELILCCLPAFILGAIFGYLPWFLLAAVTGLADLAFLEFTASVVVAVGGSQHDAATG